MIRANLRKSILMSRGRLLWNLVGCKLLLCRITFPQLLQLPSYEFFSSRNLGRWRNLGARALGSQFWLLVATSKKTLTIFERSSEAVLKKKAEILEKSGSRYFLVINCNNWMFVKWFFSFLTLDPHSWEIIFDTKKSFWWKTSIIYLLK